MAKKPGGKPVKIETLTHAEAARKNIPTAEYQSLNERIEESQPFPPKHFPRTAPLAEGETRERDEDLDPQIVWRGARIRLSKEQARQLLDKGEVEIGDAQLVWRGKDRQDWSDLVVNAPPLYIQEKIHPKAIIDDLRAQAQKAESDAPDLFADFNGLDDPEARTDFYQHDQHWSNRFILGDSLAVMASLAEREALRGKVQCIYFDPPYGIKFNSNWQVSTLSRDVKDGKQQDISREPEQIKAFRDTWKEGIHSYLTYLRDRLTVAKELLAESGSIFVQIGDENVHRVRAVMDEVFGTENFVSQIAFQTTSGAGSPAIGTIALPATFNHLVWFAKSKESLKYRQVYRAKTIEDDVGQRFRRVQLADGARYPLSSLAEETSQMRIYRHDNLTSQSGGPTTSFDIRFNGDAFRPGRSFWKTNAVGIDRLAKANRLGAPTKNSLAYVRFLDDFSYSPVSNLWTDTRTGAFTEDKLYVVQTSAKVIQRCILMTTDPGDLVLDPTCGSGTSAYVAEQWGRRWITIDTSRVALALARTRLMSARYPYYLLADSPEGRRKEQEVSGKILPEARTLGDLRQGFVYERAPHVTLKSIANNEQIDVIYDKWQAVLEPLRAALNAALGRKPTSPSRGEVARSAGGGDSPSLRRDPTPPLRGDPPPEGEGGRRFEDWEIPREAGAGWPAAAREAHAKWWEARIARQKEIDASIAKAADVELLYDRPYEDKSRVRVAGPFTVESLSPHRVAPADEEELIDFLEADEGARRRLHKAMPPTDFAEMTLEHLRTAGVHQSEKRDSIRFTALAPWPGEYVAAEGRFMEGDTEKRAAIFIGPEFGSVSRVDLAAAAREAVDARFDALIACAFAFDAHASEVTKLGPLPILKAKMNPDLHMAGDLKNTGKGNLFVVFGEPDIDILHEPDGRVKVKVKGVDIFDPNTGEIRSDDTKGIAAWFVDTNYNEESFFVRHAYFLGANDPYKSLKTALQAEIDKEAWETLYRDVSRPFERPATGKIAVKVINHFGDEVMKVFRV
ncbi:site-specific DNA-methyltransferase [Methylosinus sp. PW1]|uniref:site-specific DNA-methyltransferase n=1 Tax=Methylosinus sp. PW1 TaxID=107636 RepID=UPI00056A72BB|nr:site-specific DNA-methyltransferase [Methylosinus sp. PW1]